MFDPPPPLPMGLVPGAGRPAPIAEVAPASPPAAALGRALLWLACGPVVALLVLKLAIVISAFARLSRGRTRPRAEGGSR